MGVAVCNFRRVEVVGLLGDRTCWPMFAIVNSRLISIQQILICFDYISLNM